MPRRNKTVEKREPTLCDSGHEIGGRILVRDAVAGHSMFHLLEDRCL